MRHCCRWFVCHKKKAVQRVQVDARKNFHDQQSEEERRAHEKELIDASVDRHWNQKMKAAVSLLRDVGARFSLDTEVMRMLTDLPVPKSIARTSTGIKMSHVKICDANFGPNMPSGEWYIPADTQHSSLANVEMSRLFHKDQRVILYLHGGAMCLCSHKTHREMLLRLVGETGMILLAIEYRRPPEHPWPVPVNDCYNMYSFLANLEIPTEVMFGIQEGDGEDDEQDEEDDVEDPESKNRGGRKNVRH